MSKAETLARMRSFFGALLVLTLGVLIIIPLISIIISDGRWAFMPDMIIYQLLIVVWILLAIALGILYLASEGGKAFRPVALPLIWEAQK